MITLPDGSGVLLCPTGAGFGTVSDDYFLGLESNSDGTLLEIPVSIFQEWFSNAKEIELYVEQDYSPDLFDQNQSYVENYKQGIYSGEDEFGVNFNDSPHPFPAMLFDEYEALRSYSSRLTYDLPFNYFRYDGEFANPLGESALPLIFVYNDKFYWFRNDYANTVTTLTDTEFKTVLTNTYQEPDPDDSESEITVKYTETVRHRITKRFY